MTEVKSTQPQSPQTEREMNTRMLARVLLLEAENESLKSQLVQWESTYKSAAKGRQDFRSAMKLARKHQAIAEAERDKALEVIREYRWSKDRHSDYDRCPTCIKADALLKGKPTNA